MPPGFSPGEARGEAPCIRKPKNLPLPRRGRGLGGWGKKRKVKAGAAGGKAGKPPSGFRKGIVIRRPPGQAPRRVPQWQGQPVSLPAQPRAASEQGGAFRARRGACPCLFCFACRINAFLPPSPKGKDSPPTALAERSSRRHWLSLPRGRGPSQTPKFLSPGPPSPWLPALL